MASKITIASILKEKITKMPNEINNKKEIEKYFKEALNETIKELKKNNEDKEKKPLTKYQEFMKETQKKLKDEFPDLTAKERFIKVAEEWQKEKSKKAENANEEE
jgi:hypothetical protein